MIGPECPDLGGDPHVLSLDFALLSEDLVQRTANLILVVVQCRAVYVPALMISFVEKLLLNSDNNQHGVRVYMYCTPMLNKCSLPGAASCHSDCLFAEALA